MINNLKFFCLSFGNSIPNLGIEENTVHEKGSSEDNGSFKKEWKITYLAENSVKSNYWIKLSLKYLKHSSRKVENESHLNF